MGVLTDAGEIPLLSLFLYLLDEAESDPSRVTLFVLTVGRLWRSPAQSDSRTVSGGEFDWGGTSVKY